MINGPLSVRLIVLECGEESGFMNLTLPIYIFLAPTRFSYTYCVLVDVNGGVNISSVDIDVFP